MIISAAARVPSQVNTDVPKMSTSTRQTLVMILCTAAATVAALGGMGSAAAQSAENCGPITMQGQSGPWDYRRERWHDKDKPFYDSMLANVEANHFPLLSALLIRPLQRTFMGDIGYTLQRWPNHYRALNSLVRLGERMNSNNPEQHPRSIYCWFDRAVRFVPDDTVLRGLFADYLTRQKRNPEAIQQLREMEKHAKDNPITHYNLGLLYTALKRHDDALVHAHKAQALGHPNLGALKASLVAAGAWRDAQPATDSGAASSANAARAAAPAVEPATAASAPASPL